MFGFSMIKTVRQFGHKLDRTMRHNLVNLYRPMRWTPCFLHGWMEKGLKKIRKYPVIVEFEKNEGCYHHGIQDIHRVSAKHIRSKVKGEYPSAGFCSAHLTASAIEELLDSCSHIKRIHHDREVKALLDVATPSIHAEGLELPDGSGLTGKGVTIAVVDTGIYPHPDLRDRIVGFTDFVNGRSSAYDDNGHGTHCAGDAAGNGLSSGGQYKGPAQEASLVGVKVLDKLGSGSLSTVMDGIEWCISNNKKEDREFTINVISMSLGSTAQGLPKDDPMVQTVDAAWDNGIVVCVAAGNEGPEPRTISSHGTSQKVITVGALDDHNSVKRTDDTVAGFSSRGPVTIDEKGTVIHKPDLLSPGVNIISTRSPNSYLDKLQKSSRVGQYYFSLSGTSMATPICAGAAALLIQAAGLFTPGAGVPDKIKELLLGGVDPVDPSVDRNPNPDVYGKGLLNVEKSVQLFEHV